MVVVVLDGVVGPLGQGDVAVGHLEGVEVDGKTGIGLVCDGERDTGGVRRVVGDGGADLEPRRVAHTVGVARLARVAVRVDDLLVRRRYLLGLGGGLPERLGHVRAIAHGGRGVDEQGLVDLRRAAVGRDDDQPVARVQREGRLSVAAGGGPLIGRARAREDPGSDGVGELATVLLGLHLLDRVIGLGKTRDLGGVGQVVGAVDVGVEDLVGIHDVALGDVREREAGVRDVRGARLRHGCGRRQRQACQQGCDGRRPSDEWDFLHSHSPFS